MSNPEKDWLRRDAAAPLAPENRGYTTWEEDFTSDRCELHGFRDELVAVVDHELGAWTVRNANLSLLKTCGSKLEAQRVAEGLL